MNIDPSAAIFKPGSAHAKIMARSPIVGVALLGITIAASTVALTFYPDWAQKVLFGLAATWAIGAPAWFLYEYHFIYRESPGDGSWELFKHSQQLAIPVWASVAASLYALGSSDVAKSSAEYSCSPFKQHATAASDVGVVFLKCTPHPQPQRGGKGK